MDGNFLPPVLPIYEVIGVGFGPSNIALAIALEVRRLAYTAGLIVECCGPHDEVLKLLPPLTATQSELNRAIEIITAAIELVLTPVAAAMVGAQ